ncbi:hypothetical protein [Phenylobacterium aquaticum]|uniref:hypothetical protein n=1 Tax=Phenylobacterium aquaticum TaxID=1763816 RepID=UPI0026F1EEF2|nr:hypothetical protein [Phenylobacterium aquaticum]
MTTLSATDVALEGFRVTRENPRTFLIWSGFSFAVSIVGGLLTISLGDEARVAFGVISGKEQPDLNGLWKAVETLSPLLIMGLVVQCMTVAAVYRIVLRHADHGFGYLKLGMDEVRLILLTLIYVVIGMVLLTLVSLAAALVALAVSAAGQQVAILVGLGAELFAMGLLAFIAVRLSLAPAITFAENRLAIFESWKLTRGHAGKLAGAYVLAIACMVVVMLLALTVFTAVAAVLTGGDMEAVGKALTPDQSSLAAYFTPWTIGYLLFAAPLSAVWYTVVAAPAAVAYQVLSGRPPETDEPAVAAV